VTEDVRVVDAPAASRYEAYLGEKLVGVSTYRLEPGTITFVHTETDPELAGRGIGSRLAAGALDDVRARGLSVVALCPFIAAHIERHPKYADLLAKR
jgi:hypothetical protein